MVSAGIFLQSPLKEEGGESVEQFEFLFLYLLFSAGGSFS